MHKIGVIGLGYVGLPLAHAFSEKFKVVGFDINDSRIAELQSDQDRTGELSDAQLQEFFDNGGKVSSDTSFLAECNVYIVTVPTPVDSSKRPDLSALLGASSTIGGVLSVGDIVIYESTVYPGATEEECVPILEKTSGLTFNQDFFCGYSPERINPGDKVHTVKKIKKITSGSTVEIGKIVDSLYAQVIDAGTYLASSIKVAEAAKVIENSQRDINIAFVNELAVMFERMDISTKDVLAAAETKWNFLPFKPGLVGGHCIGVDPYYLAHKAQQLGYYPQMILSGRRINDGMGSYIATQLVKLMTLKSLTILGSNILILGITFKENCSDIRNSKVIDVIEELKTYGANISVCDPWAYRDEVKSHLNLDLLPINEIDISEYSGIVLAVAHTQFLSLDLQLANDRALYDVKSQLKISDKAL
ncbi:nucleotide sugar dehydrogenase [Pseudomonadales bacterium]|nr:nucleotide sugar dehydrogenase [Pseudomonadales bacterium]